MPTETPTDSERFRPHAAREMASMFDDVSGRYDFLNRLMTLGQDGAWRRALAAAVPENARVVLDLCTGNGVSLPGLRRPGRSVLGVDVSLGMLTAAADELGRHGWAPRLACADAFRLPLRDGALDAITVAFGVRNLRPRPDAIAEMRRVLRPGGTLAVLEAAAPRPGWFAPFHRLHLRYVVPALGRLSPDPSAYAYLSRSIFEFGGGLEFERELASAGFLVEESHVFLLGATRLWVARLGTRAGEIPASARVHGAMPGARGTSEMPQPAAAGAGEWRVWAGAQAATSAVLCAALLYGIWTLLQMGSTLPIPLWTRRALVGLSVLGAVLFGLRAAVLFGRTTQPPPRRGPN